MRIAPDRISADSSVVTSRSCQLLVDRPWIAAHFADTGTHRGPLLGVAATGRSVSTQEFAFYRVDAGRIAEVWGTADDLRLVQQLR